MLIELARDQGAVASKKALCSRLKPVGDAVDVATVELHVSSLRRKIGAGCIVTVRSVDYMPGPAET